MGRPKRKQEDDDLEVNLEDKENDFIKDQQISDDSGDETDSSVYSELEEEEGQIAVNGLKFAIIVIRDGKIGLVYETIILLEIVTKRRKNLKLWSKF